MKRRDVIRLVPLTLAGGTVWNRASAQETLRENRDWKPREGAPLSIRYLDRVKNMLGWIKRTQSDNLLEASHIIARTMLNKRTCWYSWDMGHSVQADIFPGRPGVPELFTVGYDPKRAKQGDLMLTSIWNGVNAYISGMGFKNASDKPLVLSPEDVKNQGVLIIGAPAPWGMDAKGPEKIVYDSAKFLIRPSAALWIDTNMTKLGAVMHLPGAGAPFGPVSGIIGMVTFWMMVGDACRILAREGKSLAVSGNEPELKGDAIPWIDLNDPLMDDYFDRVTQQIDMIPAELGNVKKTAAMAADAVLAGGKVYCYRRDRNSLAYESQTRRGGLTLTRGLFDEGGALSVFGQPFKGTSKDIVIMGIAEPDNATDLKHLDTFRRAGLRIISIGPMTRDVKIPDGRTVPKEADVHIGRMCDTYGLYAVPGFKRKICPTSGALLNQMYWAVCMEIADEIMRRTGNVPGVYLTGAVEGGIDHLNRVNAIYDERGY